MRYISVNLHKKSKSMSSKSLSNKCFIMLKVSNDHKKNTFFYG